MKIVKSIILGLLLTFNSTLFSQGEYVVEINRTNGVFIKTGSAAIDGITYIYPDDRAYDENTGTFIFPSALLNHSLYSINVSDGSIVNNPEIVNLTNFQFDNTTNILYGIQQDNENDVKYLVSIDPATGSANQIGNSLPSSSLFSGYSTFDNINHTFIFLAPPNILYSINAIDGSIVSNPNFVLAPDEAIANFSFDNSTGILYGLLFDNFLQKHFLAIIDPISGTNTRIGLGTTYGGGSAGSSAIDEVNQQFSYLYSSIIEGGYAITTLDIETGTVSSNALIQAFTENDNFFSLKYDNTLEKYYAIHWESTSTGIKEQNGLNSFVNIYPNPFSNSAIIQVDLFLKDAKITIENCFGQVVKQMKNISGTTILLDSENLPNGLYFINLMQQDKIFGRVKIVVEK